MIGFTVSLAWLLQGMALAVPTVGTLTLQTTPNAQVERMPRTDPFTVQFVIRENRTELNGQLGRARARWLDQGHAVAVGGGTWFVNLDVTSSDIGAYAEPIHGGWRFVLEPSHTASPEPERAPIERLGPYPTRIPAQPPSVLPAPLHGQASTLLPDIAFQRAPAWTREEPLSIRSLENVRWEWLGDGGGAAGEGLILEIGAGYLDLGLYREARYYLEEVVRSADSAPLQKATAARWASLAHLRLGNHREAQAWCWAARDHGTTETQTLRCLGRVELIAGNTNPTALAQALKMEEVTSSDHALIGALYFSDHRYEDAVPHLLEAQSAAPSGAVAALLGDALWLTGNDSQGVAQWSHAVVLDPEMAARVTAREGLAEMKRLGAPAWSRIVVPLERATRGDPRASGDAHFGISRVLAASGDLAGASEHLQAVWTQLPEATLRSDVPDRLLAACAGRIRYLGERGRWLDTIRVYEGCWRPELDRLAANNEPLRRVAAAYDHLGLPDNGLTVLRRALAASLQERRTADDELLHLAHLYIRTHRGLEALETLEHLAHRTPHAHLIEARARHQVEDVPGARRAYQNAASEWPIARVEGALLDAASGRCDAALPALLRAPHPLLDPFVGEVPDRTVDVKLATARCLQDTGEFDQAAEFILKTLETPDLPESARVSFAWILASSPQDGVMPPDHVPSLVQQVVGAHGEISALEQSLAHHGLGVVPVRVKEN
jgi:tetratricopeptide (TPR) repeat protein